MPNAPWTPEHPVDAELAHSLIRAQCPEAPDAPLVRVGAGWDMDVWRSGDLAFRFPRRELARALVETELRVLPQLAPLLPVPIPVPCCVGRPTTRYPASFYGHRFLPGRPVEHVAPDDAARLAVAPALAAFLRRLHAIPEPRALGMGVPRDTFRGDMARQASRALDRLGQLPPGSCDAHRPQARALLEAPPPHGEASPVLLHGDFYARHLLLDDAGALAGVIDWGDVCLGDVAIDLSIAYSFLPPAGREAFWRAYGPVDEATRRRARVVALSRYGLHLLAYAVDLGDRPLILEATRALVNATSP